jgi:hypothetical protein
VRKFFTKYRKSYNLDTVCQESKANAQKNANDTKQESIEVMEVVSFLKKLIKYNQLISK